MNKRTTSVFSFNVNIELKNEFRNAAFFMHTTMGPLLNKVMKMWLDEYDRINRPNKTTVPIIEPTTLEKTKVKPTVEPKIGEYDPEVSGPF